MCTCQFMMTLDLHFHRRTGDSPACPVSGLLSVQQLLHQLFHRCSFCKPFYQRRLHSHPLLQQHEPTLIARKQLTEAAKAAMYIFETGRKILIASCADAHARTTQEQLGTCSSSQCLAWALRSHMPYLERQVFVYPLQSANHRHQAAHHHQQPGSSLTALAAVLT